MARTKAEEKIELAPDFDDKEFFDTYYYEENSDELKDSKGREQKVQREKLVFKPQFGSKLIQCQIQCAKFFNIPLPHLSLCVEKLNSRQIDGFIIGELFGRHGYFDTKKKSRADLAVKYKKTIMQLDIAENKLKSIVKSAEPTTNYRYYTEEIIENDVISKISEVRLGN